MDQEMLKSLSLEVKRLNKELVISNEKIDELNNEIDMLDNQLNDLEKQVEEYDSLSDCIYEIIEEDLITNKKDRDWLFDILPFDELCEYYKERISDQPEGDYYD